MKSNQPRPETAETNSIGSLPPLPQWQPPSAPVALLLFGEEGVEELLVDPRNMELARRLFPEARISPRITADLDPRWPAGTWNPQGQLSGPRATQD